MTEGYYWVRWKEPGRNRDSKPHVAWWGGTMWVTLGDTAEPDELEVLSDRLREPQ